MDKQEFLKGLRELNEQTARYGALVLAVGALHDGSTLRRELQACRAAACENARRHNACLLRHRRLHNGGNYQQRSDHGGQESSEFGGLWTLLYACLELLHRFMQRTLTLFLAFPMHAESTVLIRTGTIECGVSRGCYNTAAIQPLHNTQPSHNDDINTLRRDIAELKALLSELKLVLNPNVEDWQQPHLEEEVVSYHKQESSAWVETSSSIYSNTSSGCSSRCSPAWGKYLCALAVCLVTIALIATVLSLRKALDS